MLKGPWSVRPDTREEVLSISFQLLNVVPRHIGDCRCGREFTEKPAKFPASLKATVVFVSNVWYVACCLERNIRAKEEVERLGFKLNVVDDVGSDGA